MEQTLRTLSAHQHITAAGVYDRTGKVVARYLRPGRHALRFSPAQPTGQKFQAERLDTFKDIVLAGETIGEGLYRVRPRRAARACAQLRPRRSRCCWGLLAGGLDPGRRACKG